MSAPSKPLLVTLVITLVLTAWALTQGEDESVVAPMSPSADRQSKGPNHDMRPALLSDSVVPSAIAARTLAPIKSDPFASSLAIADETMAAPVEELLVPTATATEPAAPESVAPKAPFKYLGSLKQEKRLVYFLTSEDKVFTVAAGERLNNDYELTAVGNDSVTLTYLPLGQAQTLPIEK